MPNICMCFCEPLGIVCWLVSLSLLQALLLVCMPFWFINPYVYMHDEHLIYKSLIIYTCVYAFESSLAFRGGWWPWVCLPRPIVSAINALLVPFCELPCIYGWWDTSVPSLLSIYTSLWVSICYMYVAFVSSLALRWLVTLVAPTPPIPRPLFLLCMPFRVPFVSSHLYMNDDHLTWVSPKHVFMFMQTFCYMYVAFVSSLALGSLVTLVAP